MRLKHLAQKLNMFLVSFGNQRSVIAPELWLELYQLGRRWIVFASIFFAVQYFMHIYRYFNKWRKNPKWSFSCCLALLLPLNELQGEVRGLSGKSFTQQQLQTGKDDMPSMSSTLKDSGAINFSLEGEERNDNKTTRNVSIGTKEDDIDLACVTIHSPRGVYDTAF